VNERNGADAQGRTLRGPCFKSKGAALPTKKASRGRREAPAARASNRHRRQVPREPPPSPRPPPPPPPPHPASRPSRNSEVRSGKCGLALVYAGQRQVRAKIARCALLYINHTPFQPQKNVTGPPGSLGPGARRGPIGVEAADVRAPLLCMCMSMRLLHNPLASRSADQMLR
jgi:hypothetical protein